MNIAIIGGGLSGLAAAWELSSDREHTITVYEASDRIGGKINTLDFVGRRVDLGPDAFLRRVPEAIELCLELGLDDLIAPAHGTARVWLQDRLVPIPGGLVLGAPVRFDELEDSDILSAEGVARARSEATLEPLDYHADRSVGDVIRERYGDEVTDRLVAPLLGGIAAGSVDDMSLDACVPQFAAAARRGTSLTDALGAAQTAAAPQPVFAAPQGGMYTLIERLIERLDERGVRCVTSSPIRSLDEVEADAYILATDALTSARLLEAVSPHAAKTLAEIPHASVVFVALAYRRSDLGDDLDASGFLVPREAGLDVTAASWSSTKWEHLAGDPVILRVSMGHSRDHQAIELSDDEVLATIRRDLRTVMGIDAEPVDWRISRFRNGFPQYGVGHLERIARFETDLRATAPNVVVCGMALRGVGIPAVVREARASAKRLISQMSA